MSLPEIVDQVLPTSRLEGINLVAIAAERREAVVPNPFNADAGLKVDFQLLADRDLLAFRYEATVDVPELYAQIAYVVGFVVADRTVFEGNAPLIAEFGERVAFPTVFPYLRHKVMEVTADLGVSGGLLLPLWRAGENWDWSDRN